MIETLQLSLHITRRNWTVYRKDFLANISPTIADPIFFILSLGIGLGASITQLEGKTYVQYIAPGLVVLTALMTSFFECSYGFFVRRVFENIFVALLTTPVGVKEILIGELIWVALKGMLMVTGVGAVFTLFGVMSNLWLFPLITIVGALVALSCGAIGLISCALVKNINQFQTVYSFVISPLFFFSGIFFPVKQMPVPVQYIVKALPLVHGVQLSQAIFWNENLLQTFLVNGGVLVLQTIVLCYFATKLISRQLYQ